MKLAVIGDPVAHSASPEIHRRLLREAGVDGSYEAIRVGAGGAAGALRRLAEEAFAGCNVTSPLKEEALAACDHLSLAAQRARAVNTVVFGRTLLGTTTDGTGAAEALRAHLGSLAGREILVLGTGPAARAVVAQLAEEGVRLWLWSRDAGKVEALRARFGGLAFAREVRIEDAVFSALSPEAQLPAEVAAVASRVPLVMDANYGDRATLGRQIGRRVVDGAEMLEAQARAAFSFWLESR
ncbi:MAG TPA: hypothetical protein VMV82_10970 [Candidatus Dormibacteraeota bacterium]|nr:hypothetical protein [Candidatus Dormibacteraeota bacterium]